MPGYVIASASIRVSLVIAKDNKGQKSVFSKIVNSIGAQNTGIMKRQGVIHRIKTAAIINFIGSIIS